MKSISWVPIFRQQRRSLGGAVQNIDLSCFYILQQILKTRTLEIESGETVVHIIIKDAEPVLLAELVQHQLFRFYAHSNH